MTSSSNARPPIAVVGVSALFPGSQDATGFWSDIRRGVDLISDVPPTHWLIEDYYDADPTAPDKTYAKRGGFLDHVDFDPMAWGVPPKLLRSTDTTQLLALNVAEAVLRDAAGGRFDDMDRSKISVILGVTSAQELISTMTSRLQRPVWTKALREHGVPEDEVTEICQRIADSYVPWEESSFPGLLGNVVAGRIANRLDLGGTNCVTDAACASTFAALHVGMQELYLGDSEMVITGGADTLNDIFMFMCFSKTPALSMSGDCRPFSDQADGTMLGEGLGMVALKRLDAAERDGDKIYAVIHGIGSSSDGRSKSVYAPVSEGQAVAVTRAQDRSGFEAQTIELLEAHGTGTKAGDVAEFNGLRLAFEQDQGAQNPGQWCALGSVKSQIGHTKAAAGAAGLFKSVMALHHKTLPPTIKVDRPNPKLSVEDSPFYLNTEARPWVRTSDHPRRAGVSAFGFGGSNFHVVLEEYRGEARAKRLRAAGPELVVLSGASGSEVAKRARSIAQRCEGANASKRQCALQWEAWASQESFDADAHARLAVVAESCEQLRAKLEKAAAAIEASPEKSFESPDGSAYGLGARRGEVAFLFPGQGSQYVGMTGDLAMNFEVAQSAWDRAAELDLGASETGARTRLDHRVFPIPRFDDDAREADELALRATEWAQPAIGAASLSLLGLVRELGLEPAAVGGHSFGELTALHAAGVLKEDEFLRVARERGELMAKAGASGEPGTMTAVVGSAEEVEAVLKASTEASSDLAEVVLANLNAPTQTVISGPTKAIEKAESALKTAGLDFKRLAVASAFHSPVVSASATPFTKFLGGIKFSKATLPVYSGESGAPYESTAKAKRARVGRQISEPVRFTGMVEAMADAGIHTFVEVGPGRVLSNLVAQILGDRPHAAVSLDRRNASGTTPLLRGLAQLSSLGIPLRFEALWDGYERPVDPASVPKAALVVPLCGANHEKPYPPPGGAADLPPPNPSRPVAPPSQLSPQLQPQLTSQPSQQLPSQGLNMSDSSSGTPKAPVQPSYAATAVTASAPIVGGGWLAAWQDAQRQTAQTHALVQQSMASSHEAYLRATEVGLRGLAAMAGVNLPASATVAPAPMQMPAPLPMAAAPMPMAAAPVPMQMPAPAAPMPMAAAPMQMAAAPVAPVPVPEAAPVPVAADPTPVAASPAVDLEVVMLAVVADKTGYPESMLELSMDMEVELGIDSIKRVEILAAVQEQAPGLPEVDAGHMGSLRTLGDIVTYMQSLMADAGGTAAAATPSPSAGNGAAQAVDLEAVMLAVVADKTGYPESMLELSMDMEVELGIDSIKRVEILAAVQEQAPALPEVDAGHMGTLRTLGDIVTYMQSLMGGGDGTAETAGAAANVAGAAAQGSEVAAASHPTEEGVAGGSSVEVVEFASAAKLGRYALELVPAPPVGLAQAGLHVEGGVYVCGHKKIGAALVKELCQRGIPAQAVTELPKDAGSVGALVSLAGLRDVGSVDEALAINHEVFALARSVAPRLTSQGGLMVTVQDSGGSFGLEACAGDRAWLAGLPALVKTAKQEWPEASLKAIDLDRAESGAPELAKRIADELLLGGGEIEVGLAADGRRRTLRSFESELPDTATAEASGSIAKGEVVVVSGGARGVTAACVVELAKRTAASFVLLGRSRLEDEPVSCRGIEGDAPLKGALLADAQAKGEKIKPADLGRRVAAVTSGREIRGTLTAIEAAGGQGSYVSVDVTDAKAVADALAKVRQGGAPIVGLVHGAGVLADKRIAELPDHAFTRVFETKTGGLRALLSATEADPLKVLCLFSSVSARCGNNGQAAYAMANEVLNKVAQLESRARPQARVRALDWGPWEGGMVSPQLRDHFAKLGVPMIPLATGAKMFADELVGASDADPPQVELVLGGEPRPEALLVTGSEARTLELEVHVDRNTHAYLADHSIAGTVVVPVVLAVEWFSRIARAFRPDLHLRAITNFKVLRGIKLTGFENGGDRLTLRCRQLSNGNGAVLGLEIVGADGAVHNRAQASLANEPSPLGKPGMEGTPRSEAPKAAMQAWGDATVYGDVLFHGREFQVIEKLDGLAEDGISGTLRGVNMAGWKWEPWHTDVAAHDGGLQMAVLWARERLGGATLPMGIGEIRFPASPPSKGPLRVVASCRKASSKRAVVDVVLFDDAGNRISELHNTELVLRPDQPRAQA